MAKHQGGGDSWRDVIPESNLFETGYYDYVLEDPVVDHTNKGYKQYRFSARLLKPEKFEGQIYFARFVVGTEEDADATDPETWKGFGARRLRECLDSIDAPDTTIAGLDKMFVKLDGEKGCVHLGQRTQTKGEYKGSLNQTDKWYKLGEREPGLIGDNGAAPARASRHAAPVEEAEDEQPEPAPRRGRRPVDEDEPDERPRRGAR